MNVRKWWAGFAGTFIGVLTWSGSHPHGHAWLAVLVGIGIGVLAELMVVSYHQAKADDKQETKRRKPE